MMKKILTSNARKLNELRRFGLDIEMAAGPDLKEVKGTMDEVIIHKTLAAQQAMGSTMQSGDVIVVEDTILEIDGKEVVDIRWKIDELKGTAGSIPARWIVSFGATDGTTVRVYRGIVEGYIIDPIVIPDGAFGFDPYFVPQDSVMTLAELELEGDKDNFSARRQAAQHLEQDIPVLTLDIKDIPAWTGPYQHD